LAGWIHAGSGLTIARLGSSTCPTPRRRRRGRARPSAPSSEIPATELLCSASAQLPNDVLVILSLVRWQWWTEACRYSSEAVLDSALRVVAMALPPSPLLRRAPPGLSSLLRWCEAEQEPSWRVPDHWGIEWPPTPAKPQALATALPARGGAEQQASGGEATMAEDPTSSGIALGSASVAAQPSCGGAAHAFNSARDEAARRP
jgi:hypothetical protein